MSKERKKDHSRNICLFLLLALFCAAFLFYFDKFEHLFTLETLQDNKNTLRSLVDNKPTLTALSFALTYFIIVSLSIPFATPLTLLGGFLFGKWLGTLIIVISATAGAFTVFSIARHASNSVIHKMIKNKGTVYSNIKDNIRQNAFSYLLFLRLVPLFPFWAVNIFPALADVRSKIFIITTFLGIIPGSFIYVNLGQALGDIESLDDILSTNMLIALGLLGFIALLPALYKQLSSKRKQNRAIDHGTK